MRGNLRRDRDARLLDPIMKALLCSLLAVLVVAGTAVAQPAPAPMPGPTPVPAPAPDPQPDPIPDPGVGQAMPPDPQPAEPPPTATEAPRSGLRVHILTSQNTYVPLNFDVFSVDTKRVVASSTGAVESRGEEAPILDLSAGTYKIVRAGEPFEARVDFAIATVIDDTVTDYLIVVDADSLNFRGSGPVVGDLPRGVEIAGLRVSLNGGGTLMFNQRANAVGMTSGTAAQFGLFGNFGLLFDKGDHLLDVAAQLRLDLVDPYTGSVMPTGDHFSASALYSYKLNNPYLGPYVRGAMRTRIFPGYLYLQSTGMTTNVVITRTDGTPETQTIGNLANPDDLRIKVADPFGPFLLQEELGANLKAIDLDLLLVKLNVGTRIGFGFRQGIMNGLLVVDGSTDEDTNPIFLHEVRNYSTLGPVIGANASVTFARWLFGSAQFGVLAPVMNTDRREVTDLSFARRLLIDFSGTAGFKVPILTNLLFASADYTFRVERDAFITNRTQFEHQLMARASITLF
jgi:hypothetical protein